jgi:hypothetical protein
MRSSKNELRNEIEYLTVLLDMRTMERDMWRKIAATEQERARQLIEKLTELGENQ